MGARRDGLVGISASGSPTAEDPPNKGSSARRVRAPIKRGLRQVGKPARFSARRHSTKVKSLAARSHHAHQLASWCTETFRRFTFRCPGIAGTKGAWHAPPGMGESSVCSCALAKAVTRKKPHGNRTYPKRGSRPET